jgi:DNA-directed RNA polymerase specialized sigma subunit
MIGIITGDIINSRNTSSPKQWLDVLKDALSNYGSEPAAWEIYRGDSFQLEVKDPYEALKAAIYIKASMKTIKKVDVRMAIGVGEKDYAAATVTESNGEAFVYSGEKFEKLKKEKQNLAVQTSSEELNYELNFCLRLALIAMDNWSQASAEFVKIYLENEGLAQKELGEILGISQSSVSERYSRAYLSEILELNNLYISKIKRLQDIK